MRRMKQALIRGKKAGQLKITEWLKVKIKTVINLHSMQ